VTDAMRTAVPPAQGRTSSGYPRVPPPAVDAPPVYNLDELQPTNQVYDLDELQNTGRRMLRAATSTMPGMAEQIYRYDDLGRLIASLGNASAERQRCEAAVSATQQQIAYADAELRKNRQNQPYMEKRIDRNEHPHFLHYFVINREQKVQRLKGELEQLHSTEQNLVMQEQNLDGRLANEQAALAQASMREQQCAAAQAERASLFDAVVASQPPTAKLVNLQQQVGAAQQQVQLNSTLLQQVGVSLQRAQVAVQLFQQAHHCLRQASTMNNMATGTAFFEAFDGNYRDREMMHMAEMGEQMQRDSLLNQARSLAMQAGNELQSAIDCFPAQARSLNPQLTANLFSAAQPFLQGASFGGTMMVDWVFGNTGAFFNDMHASGKINHNLNVIAQCQNAAAAQTGIIEAVAQYLQTNVQFVSQQIANLGGQIQAERSVMFDMARQLT